jgi:hypothetical protein
MLEIDRLKIESIQHLQPKVGSPENPKFQKQEMDFLGLSFLLSFSQVLSRSPSIRKRKEDGRGERDKNLIIGWQRFLIGRGTWFLTVARSHVLSPIFTLQWEKNLGMVKMWRGHDWILGQLSS